MGARLSATLAGLGADDETRNLLQDPDQSEADNGMVVDNQDVGPFEHGLLLVGAGPKKKIRRAGRQSP